MELIQATELDKKTKAVFSALAVPKLGEKSKSFQSLGLPSYLRDWLVSQFVDDQGNIDMAGVAAYAHEKLPRRTDWENLKRRLVEGNIVKFLTRIRVSVDVRTGEAFYSLPDLGFPKSRNDAMVNKRLLRDKGDALLARPECWGVVQLEWRQMKLPGESREHGVAVLMDFQPFRAYNHVDLEYFRNARREFTTDEWICLLLLSIDYNPWGFTDDQERLTMLSRLMPFVSKRLNLIELAPKSTGKTYVFSQLSSYGWLVSGGSLSRARLFYDIGQKSEGLVRRSDIVALDEVQTITFPDVSEMRGALKGYLESGEFKVGDYSGTADASFVLLGNIPKDAMQTDMNMFRYLPGIFNESALLDRFHGFVRGWNLPRMRENMKAGGWGLDTAYLAEIMHDLREATDSRGIVDQIVKSDLTADTRDTEAVKRLCSALVKILFPHWRRVDDVNLDDLDEYCLQPAIRMRKDIRLQLHAMDPLEYSENLPNLHVQRGANSAP
jgi:ATP-dependent Lon protease